MNTDKDKEMALQTAEVVLEDLRPLDIIAGILCRMISISFAFSLSVFICVHPWFQMVSACA
jgi:hypothetical protein